MRRETEGMSDSERDKHLCGTEEGCASCDKIRQDEDTIKSALRDIVEKGNELTTWTRRNRWSEEIFQKDMQGFRAAITRARELLK